jgi:hypothetical protein
MFASVRRLGIVAAILVAVAGTTVTLPDAAHARWGGGWHGGGWHGGHGGWGWGGFGVGLGTGLLVGAATAPYWGGYYGGPFAYGYGYGPYGYGPGYAPRYVAYGAPYAGGCHVTRRWVSDGYGHRVWRRVRVCH